jgi:hypothetical protein
MFEDITGRRFSKLLVLGYAGKSARGGILWKCRCDCGNTTTMLTANLKSNHVHSCGCARKKYGDLHKEGTAYLCSLWRQIKTRCYCKSCNGYKKYGSKGIYLYGPWRRDFNLFKNYILQTLGNRKEGMSLDRINSQESYIPGNLRWATLQQQEENRHFRKVNTTSKYRGVSFRSENKKWVAQIMTRGKTIFLGCFDNEVTAAKAYLKALRTYHDDHSYKIPPELLE